MANVKAMLSRLNKEMSKQKALTESSKAALAKAEAEKKSLLKSSTSTESAKKEVEELKKTKEKVEAELNSTKTDFENQKNRLENLKRILKENNKRAGEMKKSMDDLRKQEKDAQLSLANEKKAHEAAKKELANMKASIEEKIDDIAMAPSSESKPSQIPETTESNSKDEEKSPVTETDHEKVPPVPKVPVDGFKFVASAKSSKEVAPKQSIAIEKSTIVAKSQSKPGSVPTSEKGSAPVKDASKPGAKTIKTQPSAKVTSSNQDQINKEDSKPSDEAKTSTLITKKAAPAQKSLIAPVSKEGSLREKLLKKKRALELQISAPPAKRPSPAAEVSASKIASTPSKAEAPLPPAPSKSTSVPKPTESGESILDVTDTKKAKVIETTGISGDTSNENEADAIISSKKPVDSELNKNNADAKETPVSEDASKPASTIATKSVLGLNPNAKPFKLFGQGSGAPTFGNAASSFGAGEASGESKIRTGFGMPPSSEPKQATSIFGSESSSSTKAGSSFGMASSLERNQAPPLFGEKEETIESSSIASKTTSSGFGMPPSSEPKQAPPAFDKLAEIPKSSSSGGTFLDLKPPGASNTPLIFGSSPNIKLPTPSKDALPVGQQPFGTFKSNPFGSFGTAPASLAATPSLFGAIASKKRPLDSNDLSEDSSSKLPKVDEDAPDSSSQPEEGIIDEAQI